MSVTSVLNGIESMRSAPLMIDVLPSGQFAFIVPNEKAQASRLKASAVFAPPNRHTRNAMTSTRLRVTLVR